jgi:hypothetical protein
MLSLSSQSASAKASADPPKLEFNPSSEGGL